MLDVPAESSPERKAFTKRCAMVGVVVDSLHCIEHGLVYLTIVLGLELLGAVCSGGPLVQNILIL